VIDEKTRMSPYTTSTAQLAELIAAKLQVLRVLVRLSRRQVELIGGGDMATLIKLLAAKQTVMNQLQAIERELAPFRGEDPDQRAWRSTAERAACQAQAELAGALLAEALGLEQQAETAMLHRRDHAASALAALQTASDARTAYAPLPATSINNVHAEG
jgi:FlgN protein